MLSDIQFIQNVVCVNFWILNHVLFQFVFFPSWNLPCWATWSERQSTIQWPDYKFFRRLHTSIDESRIEMTKENNLGIFVGEVCFAGWSFSTAVTSAGDEISMLWLVLTKQEQEVCSYCAGPYRPLLDLGLQHHLHPHPAEQDNVTHLSQWNDWW